MVRRAILCAIVAASLSCEATSANAQVAFDITYDDVMGVGGVRNLGALSIGGRFYLFPDFCVDDGLLFVPGINRISNTGQWEHEASGIIFQGEIMPSRAVVLRAGSILSRS
jgi:hypothetical protein